MSQEKVHRYAIHVEKVSQRVGGKGETRRWGGGGRRERERERKR